MRDFLYRKKAVEVLNKPVLICWKVERTELRTVKKEKVFHLKYKIFFRTLEGRFCQIKLRAYAGRVFWNDGTTNLPTSSVLLLQIFSDKTVTSLKISALVAYPVPVMLSDLSK